MEFNSRLHGELDKIQELKKDLSSKRKVSRQAEKRSKELESKNKSIVEPFAKAKEDLEKLNEDAKEFKLENVKLEKRKAELKTEEEKLKDLQWRHEVLFQKYQLLEKERDDARDDFEESILHGQQRNNFNAMILNKQMKELYVIGKENVALLSNIVAEEPVEVSAKDRAPKVVSIEDLERIQSQMQHLHNRFIAPKRTSTAAKAVQKESSSRVKIIEAGCM